MEPQKTSLIAVCTLSAVIYQEDGQYVAHALEKDICSQGSSAERALYELTRAVAGTVAVDLSIGNEPLRSTPPAPQEIWDRYERASLTLAPKRYPMVVDNVTAPMLSEVRLCS